MSSFIEEAKSIVSGRSKIGIKGIYEGKVKTIDIDLVDSFQTTHNVNISTHPIEKSPNDTYSHITDFVQTESPSARMNCILSDNLNLTSSVISLSNQAISAKEKLQILLHWQRKGTVLEILGYGTGSSAFGELISFLDKGIGALFDSELEKPEYFGIDTDVIKNVILGNISVSRKLELGNDIEVSLDVVRVFFAIPKIGKRNTLGGSSVGKSNPPQKAEAKPTQNQKKQSILTKQTRQL